MKNRNALSFTGASLTKAQETSTAVRRQKDTHAQMQCLPHSLRYREVAKPRIQRQAMTGQQLLLQNRLIALQNVQEKAEMSFHLQTIHEFDQQQHDNDSVFLQQQQELELLLNQQFEHQYGALQARRDQLALENLGLAQREQKTYYLGEADDKYEVEQEEMMTICERYQPDDMQASSPQPTVFLGDAGETRMSGAEHARGNLQEVQISATSAQKAATAPFSAPGKAGSSNIAGYSAAFQYENTQSQAGKFSSALFEQSYSNVLD